MIKLSIVIVNYNVRYYVEQCLHSVRKAIEGISSEIFVVDNDSWDGSVAYLKERFPEVTFIENKENKGFAYANNQAIKESSGEYVLLLNPDTIVAENTLSGCIDFLDAHPQVGATGVRMLHADGSFAPESRRGLPTPFTSFCKMSGLNSMFPKSRVFGKYYMRYLDVEEPSPIEVISGAFNMIRRKAMGQVGLLDEDFFMYGEDIDFSYRLLQAGWQNYYLPFDILHYKGESTEKNSFRYVHVFYNAMLIFFNKHYKDRYRFFAFLIKLAVLIRAFIDLILKMINKTKARFGYETKRRRVNYIRFEIGKISYTEMLTSLKNQASGKRRCLETYSSQTGMIIRQHEIIHAESGEIIK